MGDAIGDLVVRECKASEFADCDVVFSGLDADVAGEIGMFLFIFFCYVINLAFSFLPFPSTPPPQPLPPRIRSGARYTSQVLIPFSPPLGEKQQQQRRNSSKQT